MFVVKSLFTSVPIDGETKAIEEIIRANTDVKEKDNMRADAIMKLLQLCTSITNF